MRGTGQFAEAEPPCINTNKLNESAAKSMGERLQHAVNEVW